MCTRWNLDLDFKELSSCCLCFCNDMIVCLAFPALNKNLLSLFIFIQAHLSKEWDTAASFECESHPHPPTCLFGDLAQFFVPSIQASLDEFRSKNLLTTKLMELVTAGVAVQTCLTLLTQSHVMLCCVWFGLVLLCVCFLLELGHYDVD